MPRRLIRGDGVVGSSNLSLASATERVSWPTPRPGRFTPRKETQYRLVQKAGWAAGPVWTVNTSTLKVTVIRISANENYAKYGSQNIIIRQSINNSDILT